MPPPLKGQKCHSCVRNTVLPISQEGHRELASPGCLQLICALALRARAQKDESSLRSHSFSETRLAPRIVKPAATYRGHNGTLRGRSLRYCVPCLASVRPPDPRWQPAWETTDRFRRAFPVWRFLGLRHRIELPQVRSRTERYRDSECRSGDFAVGSRLVRPHHHTYRPCIPLRVECAA